MRNRIQRLSAMFIAGVGLSVTACGRSHDDNAQASAATVPAPAQSAVVPVQTPVADTVTAHHSKVGGALIGAAAGHVLGGHAVAGAAVGAIVQHERNKHSQQQ